jgi:phospholipid/cholesterol/gamma-HCH transport system permease protein
VDAEGVSYCDISGIGLFLEIHRRTREVGAEAVLSGLKEEFQPLLAMFPEARFKAEPKPRRSLNPFLEIGKASVQIVEDLRFQLSFLGETTVNLFRVTLHPGKLRWKDTLRILDTAGVNAVPLVGLLGFLIGLILAFQSAIPMKQYGTEIFVADLVAIVVIRELGPLMTAIIMAGRSGSSFAAEIGTMKVNEEIDALTTMGIPPVQFLVAPRIIGGIFVSPLLTMFMNLLAIVGCGVVVLSMGFPLVTYINHVVGAVSTTAFVGGMAKTLVFGAIIAGIGCLRGLQTGKGALSVGISTTRSVVAGIVLVLLADMVFAVLYYAIGI